MELSHIIALTGTQIDWTRGNLFRIAISSNTAFTFSNVQAGKTITVEIENTNSSAITATFPSGLFWPGGSVVNTIVGSTTTFYTFSSLNGQIIVSALPSIGPSVSVTPPSIVNPNVADLNILNGQTVTISDNVLRQYNNVTIAAGGTLLFNGNFIFQIGVKNSFTNNGTIRARGQTSQNLYGVSAFTNENLISTVLSSNGIGGNGGAYATWQSTKSGFQFVAVAGPNNGNASTGGAGVSAGAAVLAGGATGGHGAFLHIYSQAPITGSGIITTSGIQGGAALKGAGLLSGSNYQSSSGAGRGGNGCSMLICCPSIANSTSVAGGIAGTYQSTPQSVPNDRSVDLHPAPTVASAGQSGVATIRTI